MNSIYRTHEGLRCNMTWKGSEEDEVLRSRSARKATRKYKEKAKVQVKGQETGMNRSPSLAKVDNDNRREDKGEWLVLRWECTRLGASMNHHPMQDKARRQKPLV